MCIKQFSSTPLGEKVHTYNLATSLWCTAESPFRTNSDNGSFCKDKLLRIFTPPPRFPCIAFKRYIAYLANMFQDVKFFGGKEYPVESLSWLWDRFCLCEHKDGYHTAHHLIDGGVQGFPARTATEPTWAPISANWHGDGTLDTSYKA